MKKLLIALLSLCLIMAFAACGNTTEETAVDESSDTEKEEIYVGCLDHNGCSEEELSALANEALSEKTNFIINAVYYDDLISMQLALNKGDINGIRINDAIAAYIMSAEPGKYTYDSENEKETMNYSMAVADEDTELLATLNDAIAALKEDGTLAALKEQYIDNCDADNMPQPAELPHYEGADTITVVITGDIPPMDYMNADGQAAGYNIALLTAIAEKAQLNIELISANAGSRAMMISSGKADVVFWYHSSDALCRDTDLPEDLTATSPYLESAAGTLIPADAE